MSIDRREIHNSAMLRPAFKKPVTNYFCATFRASKRHAMVTTKEGYNQCVDCGKINRGDNRSGIHKRNTY